MPAPVPSGDYRIVNYASKTVLDVDSSKPQAGTPLICWHKDQSRPSQIWHFTQDNVFTHKASSLKFSFDPTADGPDYDVAVTLDREPGMWEIKAGSEQDTFTFKWFQTTLYMDLEAGSAEDGAVVRLWRRAENTIKLQNLWTFEKVESGPPKPEENGGGGNGSNNDGRPPVDPVTLTTGIYRIRNIGSRYLLDHFSSTADDGTEVKSFFDTENPSQEWYVTVEAGGSKVTIKNLVTGHFLTAGTSGKAATATSNSTSFTVTRSSKPLNGWVVKSASNLVLSDTAGKPTDGSNGTSTNVTFAAADDSLNQRWWFTPVPLWVQNPLPADTFLLRAIQSKWVMALGSDMRILCRADTNASDQAALQWTATFDAATGTYSIISKKTASVFLALSPRSLDPTPDVTYLAGAASSNAVKWIVRARKDRTVSLTPQGWNYQLGIQTGGPNVGVSVAPISGELKYAVRWGPEPLA